MNALRTLALVASLALTGCLPTSRAPGPVLPDKPSLADAAELFVRDYVDGLRQAASETAAKAKAGEFADVTATDEHFTAATKTARESANKSLVEAMNKAFADERGKPGAATAPLFEELAQGFGRVSKKGK